MKPEISIILPAIRRDKWDHFYNSIRESTKRSFELIICGPYPLTETLQNIQNVKYIKDFGSPTRASAMATLVAEGNLITWSCDDAIMLPGAMDEAIDALYSMGNNYKNVVISKYLEGQNGTHKIVQGDWYYHINGSPPCPQFPSGARHCTYSEHVPEEYYIFNTAIMYRQFFEELGGLDCNYEHVAIADTDLAIRAQVSGANVKLTQVIMYDADHGQPDHRPVAEAQLQFDEPLYLAKYKDPNWREKLEVNIDINNWKNFPSLWTRRFQQIKLE